MFQAMEVFYPVSGMISLKKKYWSSVLFQGLLMFLNANSSGIAQKNVAADLGK